MTAEDSSSVFVLAASSTLSLSAKRRYSCTVPIIGVRCFSRLPAKGAFGLVTVLDDDTRVLLAPFRLSFLKQSVNAGFGVLVSVKNQKKGLGFKGVHHIKVAVAVACNQNGSLAAVFWRDAFSDSFGLAFFPSGGNRAVMLIGDFMCGIEQPSLPKYVFRFYAVSVFRV